MCVVPYAIWWCVWVSDFMCLHQSRKLCVNCWCFCIVLFVTRHTNIYETYVNSVSVCVCTSVAHLDF